MQWIDSISDTELLDYLPQLVQVRGGTGTWHGVHARTGTWHGVHAGPAVPQNCPLCRP